MTLVPPSFAADITRRFGEAGRRWITSLPHHLDALCVQWNLDIQDVLGFGTWSVVYRVRYHGHPAALKITWPGHHASGQEAAILKLWNGNGAVRVLGVDAGRHALLLEPLDPSTRLSTLGVEPALRIAGELLRRHAVPSPPGLPLLTTVTQGIIDGLEAQWDRLGQPMHRGIIDRTRELATGLLPDIEARVVNWDLHYNNVLRGEREPWLVIDPQGVCGDLEYGVAQLVWWRLEDTEARGGVAWALQVLTEAAALEPARLNAWVYVRTVAYWLSGLEAGLTIDPGRCARVIKALQSSQERRFNP